MAIAHTMASNATVHGGLQQQSLGTFPQAVGTPVRPALQAAPTLISNQSAVDEQTQSGIEKAGANVELRALAVAEAKRKEAAWNAYYSLPANCEHPPAWKDQVECGNQYIRAKKAFEVQWSTHLNSQNGNAGLVKNAP